ncbi:MAG: PAS domain S-box protein [Beijerinckiaceae bacterium]
MSIRQRLTLIVLAVAIPMLAMSAAIAWQLEQRERETQREATMYASRSILSAVDAQLGRYTTAAQALATSPALQADDLVAFRKRAELGLPGLSGSWVVLADVRGQQLVNTLVSASEPLPRNVPEWLADESRAFETKQVQISDVTIGPVAQIPVIAVGVPVFRAGAPSYYLTVSADVTVFRGLLNSQSIPEGWLEGIMDRSGKFIVRSTDHERWVGKPVSASWRAVMNQEGWFDIPVEGEVYTATTLISPMSGWVLATAVKKDVFETPIRENLLVTGLVGLAVTLLSTLLAAWAARRITQPIAALVTGAQALRSHEPVSFATTGVPEVDHALEAFDTASKELFAHEELRAQTQKALKQSEERLHLFVEQAPASIAMFDRQMRYLAASRRWLDNFSPNEQNVIGRSRYEVCPETPERWKEIHRHGLNGEIVKADDDPFLRSDGRTQWLCWEIRPWYIGVGDIGGIMIFADDVTAGFEARSALAERDEKLAWLASFPETNPNPIIEVDRAGRVRYLNPMAKRLFPDLEQEGLAHAWLADWEALLPLVQTNNKHDRVVTLGENTYQQAIYYVRQAECVRIYGTDITERKHAEQKLTALAGRLRAIVDTAIDAILVIDEAGIVQSFNPAAERIFGYQASEVLGNNVGMLMPGPHRTAHDGHIDAYRRTGRAKIIGIGREVEAMRKDGTTFPIDLAVAEWRMEGKRFFTGIARDITQRKQAEEHLRFVIRELSHRTKNLLAVVQTMAWKTARMSVNLEDFEERFANRVEALACSHDLLSETQWQGVRLEDLVRGQLHLFGAEGHLDAHGPDLMLRPEAAQSLGLALHELATNASKYGALTRPAGRIEVGWSVDPEDAASGQFRICWRESGGPEVSPPKRNGFGHTVIKEMTARALTGRVALEFTPQGFVWQLTAPATTCLTNPP